MDSIKFIDANIYILRFSNKACEQLVDSLHPEKHCTSVVALAEAYHHLSKRFDDTHRYLRNVMGRLKVYDITQEDFFNAMHDQHTIHINDKLHLAVMIRSNISHLISYDQGFDQVKSITRIEP